MVALHFDRHKSAVAQHCQVPRHGSLRKTQPSDQLAHAYAAASRQLSDNNQSRSIP